MRGTVRPNRGVPAPLKDLRLQLHQTAYYRKNSEILTVKYVDKREIYLLSTVDAAEVQKTRHMRGGVELQYSKPTAIETYNQRMGGVDITDQYLSGIGIVRKSHIWFKKVGLHLLQRLVLNAFLLYKREQSIQRPTFLDFSKTVIVILTKVPSSPTTVRQIRRTSAAAVDHPQHHPEDVDSTSRRRVRCRNCSNKGQRKDTYYRCPECPGRPGLCVTPCCQEWHEGDNDV